MATLQARIADLITAIGTDYKTIIARIGDLTSLTTTSKTSLVSAINEVNAKPTGAGGAAIADGDPGTSTTTTYSASKIKALNDSQDTTISGKANTSHTHTLSQITDAASKADASAVVLLTTAQTVAGIKTFSSAPVVPDASFSIAKTSGLQAALDAKAVIADASATSATTTTYSASKINSQITALETKLTNGASTAFDTFAELQALMQADDTETAGIVTALGLRLRFDAAQTLTAPQKAQGKANLDAYGSLEIGNPDTDLVALYTAAKA